MTLKQRTHSEAAVRLTVRRDDTRTNAGPVFASSVPDLDHVPLRMIDDGNATTQASPSALNDNGPVTRLSAFSSFI